MSETPQLTVPTAFNDISQLAEGMSDRVDEERLMLYGPDAVEDNAWIRFSVLLMDQSVALSGVGRAVASIDGGDERPEVARFDIVLDNLQFEGTSEVVYERMLVYRSQAFAEGPGTGEVSRDDVDAAEAALAEGGDEFEDDEASTMVASAEEYAEHVQAAAGEGEAPAAPAEEEPPPADFAGDMDEVATVVGEAPAEAVPDAEAAPAVEAAPAAEAVAEAEAVPGDVVDDGGYEDVGGFADVDVSAEAAPEQMPVAEEPAVDDVGGDSFDVGYEPPSTDAEGFADVHTEDIEEPRDEWGTDEVDVSQLDEVVEGDIPPSAEPPQPPAAPPGFTIESPAQALTRASRGATWEPNLALAPEPRAPSGLFPYASGLPVPERAPRPDLDPSYHIQPAPRPVEASGDQTDADSAPAQAEVETAADDAYGEVSYGEVDYTEAEPASDDAVADVSADDVADVADVADVSDVSEVSDDDVFGGEGEAAADGEAPPEVDASGLDYEDDYGAQDDAASFDDAPTDVVEESYDESEATRMDLEAPPDDQHQ